MPHPIPFQLRLTLPLLCLLALAGCPGTEEGEDTGVPLDGASADVRDGGIPIACARDEDCDDWLFCTGTETCVANRCTSSDPCDDGIACTVDACDEARLRCTSRPADDDGDGAYDASCLDDEGTALGDDCDDDDGERFPGNREICDGSHDEDCDPETLGGVDDDGDSFVSAACCNGATCGADCDDARRGSFPGATEVCDGLDQNCDGTIDDGLLLSGYVDADSDGYGDTAMSLEACPGTPRWASLPDDCDDTRRDVSPGQPEICDEIRNDCTAAAPDVGAGAVNWYGDLDGDGFGSASSSVTVSCTPITGAVLNDRDCDDSNAMLNPGAAELCNGIDDDCHNGADFQIAPNNFEDDDGDGLVDLACGPLGTDCNDSDPMSGPGESERCDMRDNDCDGIVDEGATSVVYYRDRDGDGYGSIASGSIISCMVSSGYTAAAGDCNDEDPSRRPGATEYCNAADDDCDAAIDETPATLQCMSDLGRAPRPPANTSASSCLAGRCLVDACTAGFDDCDGRPLNGCEVDLYGDELNCGRCGTSCEGLGPCVSGSCMRAFVAGRSALTAPRGVRYTIDTPSPGSIVYTTDGSPPGSPTSTTAPAPVTLTLTSYTLLRWQAWYGGFTEDPREFQHLLDTSGNLPGPGPSYAVSDNTGAIIEELNIAGQGSVATVAPGASVSVTVDAQYWKSRAFGYCPSCVVYFGITRATETGTAIANCLGSAGSYPGTTYDNRPFSFTAPTTPGVYPLYWRYDLDFQCNNGGGTEIGYLVVSAP